MARILTLTNWYPPHSRGGYEVECHDVMTRLGARGHQVEVLCSDTVLPETVAPDRTPLTVHRRLRMYWRHSAPWTPSPWAQLAMERDNQRELGQVLDRLRPDVVSVWHMGAISLSLLTTVARRRIPMVYAICDDWLTYGIALDPWSRHWNSHRGHRARRTLGAAAARALHTPTVLADLGTSGCFCFVSALTAERSRAASPWSYPVAAVVPAGIDRSLFPPPVSHVARPWGWKLLYVGRLDPRKGTDTLLAALPRLPEATLTFLGGADAPERARLSGLAADLGVAERVVFDRVEHSDIAAVYRAHDCVIFPSEWPEPFGLVPLEAMACGTPVVATGVGGSADFLRDGRNCLLFAPGDAAALAAVVQRMAGDAPLREALAQEGYTWAERYDVDRTADAFEMWHVAAAEGRLSEVAAAQPPGC